MENYCDLYAKTDTTTANMPTLPVYKTQNANCLIIRHLPQPPFRSPEGGRLGSRFLLSRLVCGNSPSFGGGRGEVKSIKYIQT